MRDFFENEIVMTILLFIIMFIIMLIIVFGIIFFMANADEKRCIKNGGKFVWEWSYASKCHFPNER